MTQAALIRALTSGPLNHFFGYYGINPWDHTGQRHLALRASFHDRRPAPGDVAEVG